MSLGYTHVAGAAFVLSCLVSPGVSAQDGCPASQQVFEYTGSTETYVVPSGVSELTITAIGGGGGASSTSSGSSPGPGGGGAVVTAILPVTPGEVLTILVGGRGYPSTDRMGGGGGGSFVYQTPTVDGLLVAAGGGAAGMSWNAGNMNGGTAEMAYAGTGTNPGSAGSGGNGGGGSSSTLGGSGGGGLLTDGGASADGGTGGSSVASGGAGGTGGVGADGGFGGGGAGGNTGGGGGGGFNGGGGGGSNGAGGGGSSYVESQGTLVSSHTGTWAGDGLVIIHMIGIFADGFELGNTSHWSSTVP